MNTFSEQLSIALVGILVVFIGLVIIILFIKILGLLALEKKPKKLEAKEPVAKISQEQAAVQAVPAVEEGIKPEIIAAISAALCLYYDGNEKFIVRKIKRTKKISN